VLHGRAKIQEQVILERAYSIQCVRRVESVSGIISRLDQQSDGSDMIMKRKEAEQREAIFVSEKAIARHEATFASVSTQPPRSNKWLLSSHFSSSMSY
jgi:hypothetical protein